MRLETRRFWKRNARHGAIPTAFCWLFCAVSTLAVLKAFSMTSVGTYNCASFIGINRVITVIHTNFDLSKMQVISYTWCNRSRCNAPWGAVFGSLRGVIRAHGGGDCRSHWGLCQLNLFCPAEAPSAL